MHRFAMRLGAFSMTLILGGSLALGTAAADEPTTIEPATSQPAPPATTPAQPPPPTSKTSPPKESSPPSAEPAPPSSAKPQPPTSAPTGPVTPVPSSGPAAVPPPSRGSAGPAKDGVADLKVSAAFAGSTYKAGGPATVRVTVDNIGSAAAEGVRASNGGDLAVADGWGPLGTKPGVRIEPHTSRTTELTGRILKADNRKATFSAKVTADTGDADPDNNVTSIEIPLAPETGVFSGTIVADKNDNGTIDPGEGLAGVKIDLFAFGSETRTKTTDAQGRFEFPDLPVGTYIANYQDTSFNWVVAGLSGNGFDSLAIDDSGKYANVTIKAVRSLFNTLRVTMKFDKPNYAPEDTTKVTVTLRNSSARPLTGVVAQCSNQQDGPYLAGTGPGWGDLAAGARGVTVPANGVKTVEVTEAVPVASPQFGYVTASCSFGPADYPLQARVFGSATATVLGVHATGVGVIAEDLNHNFTVDPGEERSGVTVRVADQDTGVILGEATTDDSGRFTVANLQTGSYELRVTGPWKWQNAFAVLSVVANPDARVQEFFIEPGQGQEGKRPNLKVTAQFDKQAYESGDLVHVKLTVANVGEADANEVRISYDPFSSPTVLAVNQASLGDLGSFGRGAHIAAGETRVLDVTGTIQSPDRGVVTWAGQATLREIDNFPQNNAFDISASVTMTTGDYAGRIYADRNGNGTFDDGEGLGGILVHIFGGAPAKGFDQATKPDGSFAFPGLNTGQYFVSFEDPAGRWVPLGESGNGFDVIQLDKTGHVGVLIKAERPLSDSFAPALAFTKDSYAEEEIAHLTVTLVNKGTADLTGVKAICNSEAPNGLTGGPGWGALDRAGEGVTVPAGTTRVFDVSEKVPVGSREFGDVFASCTFAAKGYPEAGHPHVLVRARVPGAIGSGTGRLAQPLKGDESPFPKAGDPIPDTKVVLLDGFTHQPVAKTRTGSDGRFSFSGLPAGQYELVVVGPWKFFDTEFGRFFNVSESGSDRGDILLVPGPQQEDPFPDTEQPAPGGPGTPGEPENPAAPQPQGSVALAALASTGASVAGLAVLSMALLLTGFGVVVAGRRRHVS